MHGRAKAPRAEARFGVFTLTAEHPASHYGVPVLVDRGGRAYGPAEDIQTAETRALFGTEPYSAAKLVAHTLNSPLTGPRYGKRARDAARLYLRQWPQGPQLDGLSESEARTQAAAEAFDALPAISHCRDGRGILHDHPAEGWLTSPNGKHIGQMCERHARDVIDEYQLKLGWSWTFQTYREER